MIRLLAVRAAIATLKRAISLSDRLKPATWEFLAICCAALFILSAWGLQESHKQRTRRGTSSITPQVVSIRYESVVHPNSQPFNISVRGKNYAAGSVVRFHLSGDRAMYGHVAIVTGMGDAHLHRTSVVRFGSSSALASMAKPLIMSHMWDRAPLFTALSIVEDRRFTAQPPGLPDLMKFFRQAPTVIYQPSPEKGGGLGKEVMFWAPILGLLLSPITGVGMLILGWLGHHRRRREEILLQLQVTKINLENENLSLVNEKLRLELALAQQEADKPRIIPS